MPKGHEKEMRVAAKKAGFTDADIDGGIAGLADKGLIAPDSDGYAITKDGIEMIERDIIKKFGEFKKITDITSGKSYKVPTIIIMREGIRQEDLKHFPEWTD